MRLTTAFIVTTGCVWAPEAVVSLDRPDHHRGHHQTNTTYNSISLILISLHTVKRHSTETSLVHHHPINHTNIPVDLSAAFDVTILISHHVSPCNVLFLLFFIRALRRAAAAGLFCNAATADKNADT